MIQPPDLPPGWFDGSIGLVRAAYILGAAALLGLAIGAIDAAARHQHPTQQESNHGFRGHR